MPAELAMLHETAPAPAAILEAFGKVCPGGSALELRDGQITVLMDDLGRHVMTIFPSVPIEMDVRSVVHDLELAEAPVAGVRSWIDVTIPLGDDGARERAARQVAQLTNGWLHVRQGGEPHV